MLLVSLLFIILLLHVHNVRETVCFVAMWALDFHLPIIYTSTGHYTINDKLVTDSPKIATAPFKSTTERKMMQSPVPFPGPGSYKPFGTAERQTLKQQQQPQQSGFQ